MAESTGYEQLWQTAPCGLLVTDEHGIIRDVNDTLLNWMAYDRASLVGARFIELLDPGSAFFYENRQVPVLRLTGEVREVSLTLRRPDGSAFPALLNAVVTPENHVLSAVFDATERHNYERELLLARRAAEASEQSVRVLQNASREFGNSHSFDELAAAVIQSARTAFAASDVALVMPNGEGDLVSVAGIHGSGAIARSWWPSAVAYTESRVVAIGSPDESSDVRVISGLREGRMQAVLAVPMMDAAAGAPESTPLGTVTSFFARRRTFDQETIDLASALMRQAAQAFERVRLTTELERLALRDPLTGLANRTLLAELLESGMASSTREEAPLAVIFLDIDGFKAVNDSLGHSRGDALLLEVSERISSSVRHNDWVGRFGGDEFVVVCEHADEAAATAVAERIRLAIAAPFTSTDLPVSASVGVAVYRNDPSRPTLKDELLIAADRAMYQAKAEGKNRVVLVGV